MNRSAAWNTFLDIAQKSGFIITIAALPLNNMFMSLGTIWLASACFLQWITDLKRGILVRPRWQRFISNPSVIAMVALYALVVLGLLWTEDMKHGMWDVRMKLPLLILPFAMITLNPLSEYWIRILKGVFILSLTFAVLFCLSIYVGINQRQWSNVRDISVFISHIRFSLLILVGIAIVFHDAWNKGIIGKCFSILIVSMFCYFLYVIESITGIALLFVLLMWMLIRNAIQLGSRSVRLSLAFLVVLLPIGVVLYLQNCYTSFFAVKPLDWNQLPKYSSHGEVYDHTPVYPLIEDGEYPLTYIAWSELISGWATKSSIHADSADAKGNPIKGTMVRYLSSKGLKRDLEGVNALTEADVHQIENGITSCKRKNRFRSRIDAILFEYSNFLAGGNSNGHSVIQRIEFWRAAWHIMGKNFWIGVGTGDTKLAFEQEYNSMKSKLDQSHRLRSHNQYFTFQLTYGVLGSFLILSVFILPLYKHGMKNKLLVMFLIIASCSFLTEDTLETQAGVMFFVFFYVFFQFEKSKGLHSAE